MNNDTIKAAEEDKFQAVINACAELSSIVYNDQLAQKDEQIKELVEALEKNNVVLKAFNLGHARIIDNDELIKKYKG